MPSQFIPNAPGADTAKVMRQMQETKCDEAVMKQFLVKEEGKCIFWKVLIAPGMNSNGFYCPVLELVWSQSRMIEQVWMISCKVTFDKGKLNAPSDFFNFFNIKH